MTPVETNKRLPQNEQTDQLAQVLISFDQAHDIRQVKLNMVGIIATLSESLKSQISEEKKEHIYCQILLTEQLYTLFENIQPLIA